MQVLVERIDDVRNEILTEEINGVKKKKYIIEGISIQAEVKNRNGRVYPKNLIKPEIDRFIREDIALGRAVGHLNHPANDPRNDYKEVSHKYESLVEDGNNWIGRAVVTTGTPNGRIVAGLMDEGVNMGTSTRALGKTKMFESRGKKTAVVQSFKLISPGDIVSDPSAPDAYLTNLMEGKEWVWENGLLMEREVEIRAKVNNAARTGQLNESKMIELFQELIKLSATDPAMLESENSAHLHVAMNSKSDRTHRGAGKEIASEHGGHWGGFYSAKNNVRSTVHVIKVNKAHAEKTKAALEKHHDINHVVIHHNADHIL